MCVCVFRPVEISAKRPAPFLRQVVAVKKPVSEENLQIKPSLCSSPLLHILQMFVFFVALFTQTLRDPRFDDLSGEYKPEIFEKTYKFIKDIKHREKEVRALWIRLL